jgi:SAM-dependent methyltransferase
VDLNYLKDSNYHLEECNDCLLIYQREIPGLELMSRLYEQWLDPDIVHAMEQAARGARYYVWSATQIGRVLDYLGGPLNTKSFLDFGMGWGHWCLLAKGFGCDAYGAELSMARCENATRSGITVIGRDQLSNHRFDFINAEQVFEHIAEPLETLRELATALKPGGIVRISVPPGWDIKRRLRIWNWNALDTAPDSLNPVAPLQHINCYRIQSLVTMGKLAGLREIELPERNANPRVKSPKDAVKLLLLPLYRRLLPGYSKKRALIHQKLRKEKESIVHLQRPE